MTAQLRLDHVGMLRSIEEFGIIKSVVRRARVVGLAETDYAVLLEALDEAGVPIAGDVLSDSPKFRNLVLKKREVGLVDQDAGTCDVELTYGLIADEGQSIDQPPYGILVGKMSVTMSQATTTQDRDGNDLVVTYTYPSTADPSVAGQDIPQGGVAQYQRPQKSLSFQGIKKTQYPWLIANGIVGKVNSGPFAGGQEGQWLCTSCDWDVADGTDPNRYYFTFSFEFNEADKGWQPTVVFADPFAGGKPVPDPVPGVGSITALVYDEVSFEQIMGVRVQGA